MAKDIEDTRKEKKEEKTLSYTDNDRTVSLMIINDDYFTSSVSLRSILNDSVSCSLAIMSNPLKVRQVYA